MCLVGKQQDLFQLYAFWRALKGDETKSARQWDIAGRWKVRDSD
jgi:hypothetical protein